jgi:hypothetical protein
LTQSSTVSRFWSCCTYSTCCAMRSVELPTRPTVRKM